MQPCKDVSFHLRSTYWFIQRQNEGLSLWVNQSLNRFFSKTQIQSGTKLPRVAPVDAKQCCCGFIWKNFSGGALKCMLLNIYLFIELLYKALWVLTFIRKEGVLEFSAIPQKSYSSICFSIFVYVNMR